jgi:DNA polymerase-4
LINILVYGGGHEGSGLTNRLCYPDHRAIIHMDLDAFFVSVECLRDNRLKGKPLLIGGAGDRGVVASCSYEARHFGIHSAMPMRLARQLCPDAIVISGDMDAYSRYSRMITEIIQEEAPLFEKSSIDEFYIDATGMDRFFGCFRWGSELRQKIIRESGLTLSMGLSINKLVSKVATGESKPNGQRQVIHGHEKEFLDPLPIRKIPMIGEKTSQFLMDMGIYKVRTLRMMPMEMLQAAFGKNGIILWKKANGEDETPVVPYHERKSISTEITFESDSIDIRMMRSVITAMIEKVTFQLRKEHKLTSCIAVKLRYSDFETVSMQRQISYTSTDKTLIKQALELFDRLYTRRLLIRLIGVRLSGLVHGHYQIDLFEDTHEDIRLHQAMDRMKMKYGPKAIIRAVTLNASDRLRMNNNLFKG